MASTESSQALHCLEKQKPELQTEYFLTKNSMLAIQPSPVHGLGVFATQDLKPSMTLAEFTGDKYTFKEFKEKYGNDTRYCHVARRTNSILCAKESRNIITYINESESPNVVIRRRRLRPLRRIAQGEELFLHYANDYPRDYVLVKSNN